MLSIYEVHGWINHFEKPRLSTGIRFLLDCIRENMTCVEKDKAVNWINQLILYTDKTCNRHELAEVCLACGILFYELEFYSEGLKCIRKAVQIYTTRDHPYALAKWIEGHFLWLIPGTQPQAIQAWQRSIDKVMALSKKTIIPQSERLWYSQIHEQMVESVDETLYYSLRSFREPIDNHDIINSSKPPRYKDHIPYQVGELKQGTLVQTGMKTDHCSPVNCEDDNQYPTIFGENDHSITLLDPINVKDGVRIYYNQQPVEGDIVLARVVRERDKTSLEALTIMGCFIGFEPDQNR